MQRTQTKTVLFIVVLVLLITFGFNRGWLAWQSEQRPIGKLRPIDLVTPTSVASVATNPLETTDPTTKPVGSHSTSSPATGQIDPLDPDGQPTNSGATATTDPITQATDTSGVSSTDPSHHDDRGGHDDD
jgi:hypothetical protein